MDREHIRLFFYQYGGIFVGHDADDYSFLGKTIYCYHITKLNNFNICF